MASNRLRAIAISLAVALAPMGAGQVLAQNNTPATAASLQATIQAAAASAAKDPTFAGKTPALKLAAIQAAVSKALAATNATPEMVSAALVAAVESKTISAGVAIQVAAAVSPDLAQQVASSKAVTTQLAATNQTATITASTDTAPGAPSVLVSLQGTASTSTGGDVAAPAGTTTTVTPAPYDPCAGVIAAYCG
jgi:hypothetical protein